MTWRYGSIQLDSDTWGICEIYHDENSNMTGYTGAVEVMADGHKELLDVLEMMRNDIERELKENRKPIQ